MDDKSGLAPLAQALAARGIATWNIEYRRIGQEGAGWPGTFEDVAAGVDHLRALARRYPLDLSRLSYIGHSSGAHLALWAASRHRLPRSFGHSPALRPVSAVVIDGPGTLAPLIGVDRQVCGRDVIVPLMGGTPAERPEAYRLATPADNLPLGLRQIFVPADLAGLMRDYIEASRASGDEVQVLTREGADHFNVLVPSNPIGGAVVDLIVAQAFPERSRPRH
jgi:acetyl esterase/lipase